MDITQYHVDTAIKSQTVMALNDMQSYASLRGCAYVPVPQVSGKIFIYGRGYGGRLSSRPSTVARNVRSLRLATGQSIVIDETITSENFQTTWYSLKDFIADTEIRDSTEPLAPILDATIGVMNAIQNDIEYVFSLLTMDSALYNAANSVLLTTGGAGTTWKNSNANSDPLGTILTGRLVVKKNLQREPNTLIITDAGAKYLAEHAELKAVLQYTDGKIIETGTLPRQIRGLKPIVADAIVNTAAEGASYTGGYAAQDYTSGATNADCAIICYVPPNKTSTLRSVTSFSRLDCADASTGAHGLSVKSWYDKALAGWWVEANQTVDFRCPIQDGAALITGAYLIRGLTI